MSNEMFSIKMRANKQENGKEIHISGAEKIITQERLETCVQQLLQRALTHSKGNPDGINIKLERIQEDEILHLQALPVRKVEVQTPQEGLQVIADLLKELGLEQGERYLSLLKASYGMRGAMLLHVDTLERLEPNQERGIRATYMDVENYEDDRSEKNHFKEALVLATKVAHHPNIVGEICISDDPDYVTGYFASKQHGYVRITKLKEPGCPDGGRIFLFRGTAEEAADCIHYLEKEKVLVNVEAN